MKTVRVNQAVVIMLALAVGSAMVGQAEKPIASSQPDPLPQDSGQKQKTMFLRIDNEAGEGQQAQQKVLLEIAGAEAQVVKGKPYSADSSTETVQTLTDGNRIAHRTVSKFYRDSEGRTRREETFGNVDPEHPSPHEVKVFIDDPVAGTAFVLDPGSKTADKMQRSRKFLDERSAEDDGTRIMFKSVKDDEVWEQSTPERMMLKFRDVHSGNPDTMVLQIQDDKRDVQKEELGTKNIEGVECTGTRQTITIAAGAIGNEKPISLVTETWFAPLIAAVVQSTSDDPRYGKTTYQLTNVQLTEPSRTLFEPPADFKVNARK